MIRKIALALAVSPLALSVALAPVAAPLHAQTAPAATSSRDLVAQVNIPYQQFTLPNGLRVIVHTDRKAPIVAVSVWYNVGSKHEPQGKTGFAHLFEHLMFNGSEHAPGDFFEPLQQVGATDFNGTTWFDRTNYFETVPTGALDVALFLESDRMGHLLGAVTQDKLDNQRGVVQNEKRQGDNQPYGLVEYAQLAGLLPSTHPYGHSTIGSMADLDAASLQTVKDWFTDHYGPNNAVLVLAGDIDLATARAKVTKWFGEIPAGKLVQPVTVTIPSLPARKDEVMKDRVATTRLYRYWTTPGLTDPDSVPLDVGASVLGGLASSRLDKILVRQEQLAVRVSADMQQFAQLGFFEINVDVKPGVDPAKVSARLDEIVADYLAKGPSADEVQRVVTSELSRSIGGLEQVGGFSGKAVTLAEGALYAGDPDIYKKQMEQLAATTPDQVRAAMQKWIGRPVYALKVEPGARAAYDEAGAAAQEAADAAAKAEAAPSASAPPQSASAGDTDRAKLPEVGQVPDIDFPKVEVFTLSNGVKVHLARRTTVPIVRMTVAFNAGNASDPRDKLGLQSLMVAMMDEGTRTRSANQIAEEQERLGASIGFSQSMDRTSVSLYALKTNLAPSLDLMSDMIQHPAFDAKELERVRAQQLARIASEQTQPQTIALRALPPILYGKDHPYGVPFTGTGDPAVVAKITTQDLASYHNKWIRADTAEIFVVGDATAEELKPLLEKRFGAWRMTRDMPGRKDFSVPVPAAKPGIVLIDRPDSPQSVILGGELLAAKGTDDLLNLISANEVVGGSFLSRMNMDLRETKGWSYGVFSSVNRVENQVPWIIVAPVQADQTGPSIAALKGQLTDFLAGKGVTAAELERTVNGNVRELSGSFETSANVLGQIQRDAELGRPADYVTTLAARYRALTPAQLDDAARKAIDPAKLTWVVVGDKAKIMGQLEKLGMPITVVEGEAMAPEAPAGE
ncbi:MAG: pitrilysin family protein [Sphingobium sp.]|nr:pitrilysin family protein [Sphingobium sp.]